MSIKNTEVPDLWTLEAELTHGIIGHVCGVDEAGRGPLAGSVYAAAVILPKGIIIDGLNDSKKLTSAKREKLYEEIISKAVTWCVAAASVEEIEKLNILNATYLAMNRAISGLNIQPALALIDGNRSTGITTPNICVVKGDGRCASIAAASILAKVSRDRYMAELADKYPGYGFEKHMGYGTRQHYAAIHELGPCPEHRMSFLKKMH